MPAAAPHPDAIAHSRLPRTSAGRSSPSYGGSRGAFGSDVTPCANERWSGDSAGSDSSGPAGGGSTAGTASKGSSCLKPCNSHRLAATTPKADAPNNHLCRRRIAALAAMLTITRNIRIRIKDKDRHEIVHPQGNEADRRHLHRGGGAGQAPCAGRRPAARRSRRRGRARKPAAGGSGVPRARRQLARRADLASSPRPLRLGAAHPPGGSGLHRPRRAQHPQGCEPLRSERARLRRPSLHRPPAAGGDRAVPHHTVSRRPQRVRRLRAADRGRRQEGVLLRRLPRARAQGRHVRVAGGTPARRHRRIAHGGNNHRGGQAPTKDSPRKAISNGISFKRFGRRRGCTSSGPRPRTSTAW